MDNSSILSYELVDLEDSDNSTFMFPNYLKVPNYCKKPEECKITCLSYRSENKEQVRNAFSELLNQYYIPKEELEKEKTENQNSIEKTKFKNLFNPFDKNKSRNQKLAAVGLDALYISPFVSIPVGVIAGIPQLWSSSAFESMGIFFSEIFRRVHISTKKEENEEIEKKLNYPHHGFFCKLKDIAPKMEVDVVYVEEANEFLKDARKSSVIDVTDKKARPLSVNYKRANNELVEIYEDFIARNCAPSKT